MIAARRVYIYLVSFVSLLVAAWGAAEMGRALIDAFYPVGGSGSVVVTGLRQDVARNGALLLVGLPVWLLHWTLASRAGRHSTAERAATLRRLYLYAVLASMVIAIASSAQNALEAPLRAVLGELTAPTTPGVGRQIAIQLPWLVVGALLWAYHRAASASDRAAAGEVGGGATLRRWYVYGVAFVAFLYLLANLSHTARITWGTLASGAFGSSGPPHGLGGAIATALVALAVWLTHWTLIAVGSSSTDRAQLAAQDARSTLRPVYLFGALAVAVALTLGGLSQLLYYALGRLLGVERPGGVGGNLLGAMAGPATTALVYGVAWLYQRRAVAAHAADPVAPTGPTASVGPAHARAGIEGVGRLYVYLVSLLAVAVIAAGAGGVLWTLADLATSAPRASGSATWWREQVSLYTTLLAVGLPVWALHWGPRASRIDEASSLARRIYLYVTLGAAVLALLGSGVAAARELLLLVLGESATSGAITNLARALSVSAVSATVIAYHLRVLRRDLAAPRATPAPAPPPPPPHEDRPYAVAYGAADGAQRLDWFASREEAHAAAARAATSDTWATVLRRDEPPATTTAV